MDNFLIRRFGKDESFYAAVMEGYLCVICWGGTAYAKKTNKKHISDDMIKDILYANEREVIDYCKINNWFLYNYYDNEILDCTSRPCKIIFKLSGPMFTS